MASLLPNIRQTFYNANGTPLVGGRLYAFVAGTDTPGNTYADEQGTILNEHPIVLNDNGEANIFLDHFSYKFRLENADGVTQWTIDNIDAIGFLRARSITREMIAEGSVTEEKIRERAVSEFKFEDAAVDGTKIQELSITEDKIRDGSITIEKVVEGEEVRFDVSSEILNLWKLWTPFTKLPNPSTLPANNAYGVAWSPDERLLAVAHDDSPFVTIYSRDGDTFTKLNNPSTLPGSTGRSVDFSSNGQFLAVGTLLSSYLNVYERDGDTFTNLESGTDALTDDVINPPTGTSWGVAFSPRDVGASLATNEGFLAVGSSAGFRILIYRYNIGSSDGAVTFTRQSSKLPSTPDSTIHCATWLPETGLILAVGHTTNSNNPNSVTVYRRHDDDFFFITHLLPDGITCFEIAFSPDGRFLACCLGEDPYIAIFERDGINFTRLPDPNVLPSGSAGGVSWAPDGSLLFITHSGLPYITVYERDGNTFTKISDFDEIPLDNAYDVKVSPSGSYLAVAHDSSPYISIYKRNFSFNPRGIVYLGGDNSG